MNVNVTFLPGRDVACQAPTAHWLGILVLLLAALAELPAALGGVPERPIPGRSWPTMWVAMANDDLNGDFGASDDDYRTASVYSGMRIDRVIALVDYSMLTVREEDIRSDELTLSLGALILHEADLDLGPGWQVDLAAGFSYRRIGDLGGDEIQNDWHQLIDVDLTSYQYEEDDHEVLVWVNAEATWKTAVNAAGWRFGWSGTFRGLTSVDGVSKCSPALHLMASHGDKDFWIGARQEFRGGEALNRTKEIVREQEDGGWLTYGIRPWRYLYLTGGIGLEHKGTYGAIGFVWPAPEPE